MLRALLAAFASLSLICSAYAMDYPTKPIRILVGWSPGGVADVAARIIAQKFTQKWHENVIVENRPGAGGIIADGAAVQAAPDGYTLLLSASPEITTTPYLRNGVPKYFNKRLIPVGLVSVNPMVLMANSKGPYRNVKELVAAAKAKPGQIAFSSAGVGSGPHLAGEIFADEMHIKLKHVPYKGGRPAALAVATGEVPIGFASVAGAIPLVKAGRVRVLGLSIDHRLSSEPNWPTLEEDGVPNFNYTIWTGLFVQGGTPANIVSKLDSGLRAILSEPDVAKKFEAVGAVVGDESLAAFKRQIKHDIRVNRAILKKEHIHVN